MKILQVNKYFLLKGGSERYLFELSRILESHGHEVIPFAMQHPDNEKTPYAEYFVDQIEFNLNSRWQKLRNAPKIISRILYSWQARRRIEALIRKTRPDVAHLHMIEHQISPSILHSLKKYQIPVIMTAHQSKIFCPNYRLFNWNTMQNCMKCLDGNYWHPFIEKCHKNSRMAGLLIGIEAYIHKWLKLYTHHIDLILTPSRFFSELFRTAGFTAVDIEHQFSTIRMEQYKPCYEYDNYYIYFGRLEEAKGLNTLLLASKALPGVKLKIIGKGPYREPLEDFAKKEGLDHVEFTGALYGDELKSTVSRSRFIVVPSECYENSPLVAYEAAAMGKPVIGSKIGGIPELVLHEKTGLLFEAGNSDDLAAKLKKLYNSPHLLLEYGKAARRFAEENFSADVHYQKMIARYERLAERRNA